MKLEDFVAEMLGMTTVHDWLADLRSNEAALPADYPKFDVASLPPREDFESAADWARACGECMVRHCTDFMRLNETIGVEAVIAACQPKPKGEVN